jgi:hypothetical protein
MVVVVVRQLLPGPLFLVLVLLLPLLPKNGTIVAIVGTVITMVATILIVVE